MARRGTGAGRDQVGREKGSRGRPMHRPRASRQEGPRDRGPQGHGGGERTAVARPGNGAE